MSKRPPRGAEWLLSRLMLRRNQTPVLGDFEEIYHDLADSRGVLYAVLWYWAQILKSIPGFILGMCYWGLVMFRSTVKITWRSILRHKLFSMINISGLALGMACSLLISLWVLDELSFDRFHDSPQRLYRIEADEDYTDYTMHTIITPPPLAPVLPDEVPEVELAARFTRFGGMQLRSGDQSFFERDIRATDPSFFHMFSFPLLAGDAETALDDPFSIVLSRRMAEKYFGAADPLGQVIQAENKFDLLVTGIIQNPPANSMLQYDWIVPFVFVEQNLRRMPEGWSDAISTFVLLRQDAQRDAVESKVTALIHRHRNREPQSRYRLCPLTRMRLHQVYGRGEVVGTIKHVYIFSLIGLFVLVIACSNFMNLTTASSLQRAREIGMRKVVGAQRGNLIRQFYGESLLYTLAALVLAMALVIVLLPVLGLVSGKSLTLAVLGTLPVLWTAAGITLFTAMVAGSYPALLLSSYKPALVLRALGQGRRKSLFRRTLVVVQFSLSIILIIGTAVVVQQTRFMKGRDVGYDRNNLLLMPLRGNVGKSYTPLKNRLLQDASILGVTAMSRQPAMIGDYARDASWQGKDPDQDVRVVFAAVDYGFLEVLGLELIEGRTFSRDFSTDVEEAFLINQETAKLIGTPSAVGTPFSMFGRTGSVIGVVKNFNFQPLRQEIQPLVFLLAPNPHWLGNIVVRVRPGSTAASVAAVKSAWTEILPDYPFEYRFVDEEYDLFYQREVRMGRLLGNFAFIAVFIACLGLFGLSSYTVEQRTKEIGIRKILGASSATIVAALCRDFARLVALAALIAWPVAYLAARQWLSDFAYRIRLGIPLFFLTGLLALSIALLTVSFQAFRAARANPADSLQYE
jgi:putative ABC transport system permease protein